MGNNNVFDVREGDFEKEVLKDNKPVAVYFYSDDCLPCSAFSPLFERLSQIYGEKIKFVKVCLQQDRDLGGKYNVRSTPTVMFLKDGEEVCSRLTGYITKSEFRESVENFIEGKCKCKEKSKVSADVLVLGSGPAGLSAAIYTARAKLFTVVVDEGLSGGQVATTYHVANYPGTNGVVRGLDLMENMKKQALDFGTAIDELKEISKFSVKGKYFYIESDDTDYQARSVIIATGATPRKLPAQGEAEFRGRGVHYCATCDGAMYQDKDVLVVGGGNSAVEEAVFLTRYVNRVTIIHQLDYFQAAKAYADEALKHPKIDVLWNTEIRKVSGDKFVENVLTENIKTGEKRNINTDGVFVYIGLKPRSGLFNGILKMDGRGYIITDDNMQTSVGGIYAAGDIRKKLVRQIGTAVGDGITAGFLAERFLNG